MFCPSCFYCLESLPFSKPKLNQYVMYQYNYKGRRWYYKDNTWFVSVTEFVKNALPTPAHLIKWYKENSAQEIDKVFVESTTFGTEFHNFMECILATGRLGADAIEDERMALMVAAGTQFLADYEVKPIGVEQRVSHLAMGDYPLNFAGTVDLVAETDKGIAIIDWKTGNIWDSHKYQMMCYLLALKQMDASFAKTEVSLINVRPKEWRGAKPTYEAKEWKVTEDDWKRLGAMMTIYEFDEPKPRRLFNEFILGDSPTWDTVSPERFETETDMRRPF